jgi:hypothetical protein
MPEKFWFQEPLVLIHPKYLHRFFPSEKLHLNARMNSIVRACVYIGITLTLLQRNVAWLLLPIFSLGFTASWMYKESPSTMKYISSNEPKKEDPDVAYLVSVILDGHPMKNDTYKRRKRRSRSSTKNKDLPKNLFRDTDSIMQDLQEERAKQTDAVSGRVPDTPNFARKLLGMDSR